MNKSDLRNIIKEEVRKVINTTLTESNLKDMLPEGPGTYKIEFTTSNERDSFAEATVTVTQEQMDLAKKLETNGYNFWKDAAKEANSMFTSGNSVLNVTKIN